MQGFVAQIAGIPLRYIRATSFLYALMVRLWPSFTQPKQTRPCVAVLRILNVNQII